MHTYIEHFTSKVSCPEEIFLILIFIYFILYDTRISVKGQRIIWKVKAFHSWRFLIAVKQEFQGKKTLNRNENVVLSRTAAACRPEVRKSNIKVNRNYRIEALRARWGTNSRTHLSIRRSGQRGREVASSQHAPSPSYLSRRRQRRCYKAARRRYRRRCVWV